MSGWLHAPDVLWRNSLDGAVLLPPGAEAPLVLDAPGAALWTLLDEPHSLDAAADALADATGVDAERIADDIAPLLDDLRAAGAVAYQS